MDQWITSIMNDYGYIGIFMLVALENVFPPIPSEVILTFGGFMTLSSGLHIPGVLLASTSGSVVGAVVLYGIGLLFDVEKLEKIIEKWGHILRLKKKDIHKADKWFDKYGPWAVFFCRFIPLIRSLISVPAGMSNMNFLSFIMLTTLGTLIWNTALVFIGVGVGESWQEVVRYMDIYSKIIYVVVGILLAILVYVYKKKRKTYTDTDKDGK